MGIDSFRSRRTRALRWWFPLLALGSRASASPAVPGLREGPPCPQLLPATLLWPASGAFVFSFQKTKLWCILVCISLSLSSLEFTHPLECVDLCLLLDLGSFQSVCVQPAGLYNAQFLCPDTQLLPQSVKH